MGPNALWPIQLKFWMAHPQRPMICASLKCQLIITNYLLIFLHDVIALCGQKPHNVASAQYSS